MSTDSGSSQHSRQFTSWKLNLIDAMLGDKDMGSADFRVAVAVLQRVNQFTKVAIVSDHSLQKTIKRDRKTLMQARKRLKSLGWLEVRTGRYGKATEYRILDARATRLRNNHLDQQILDTEEDINDASSPHYEEPNIGEKTPHQAKQRRGEKTPHCGKAHNRGKTPHSGTDAKTSHSEPQWGENTPHSGEVLHPLHLQTPKRETLPVKDIAPEAHEAHVIAFDRWTEFEETAARLEFDEQLTPREAEHQARVICGFDDADAGGRQGVGTAPPAVVKRYPDEGIPDDQDHPYHGF